MKPHIIIVMHYMEIGGAETALVGLLNALDPKKVDVDLFLHDHRGEMMQFIPKWINVLPAVPKYTVLERSISELVKRGYWGIAIARLLAKYLSNRAYRKSGSNMENASSFDKLSMCTTPLLPKINPKVTYDLAISFCTPHRIVQNKVRAKKKIAWIHTDYTRKWVDRRAELKVWSQYDYIASISRDVTKTFLQVYPSLNDKIIEIENILSPTFVRERSVLENVFEVMPKEDGMVNLLSVGRFCEAKNYDNLPFICKQAISNLSNLNSKLSIKWYIVGGGGNEQLVKDKIKEAGMEENVILLGVKTNPYPYIKACDFYVQPSRYEGKSVTVREAQMLCKPVVVTNYPTASSQIKNGYDGVIVPMDNGGCAKGIADVICDKALQEKLISYLQAHDYGNEMEVDKIYRLLGI